MVVVVVVPSISWRSTKTAHHRFLGLFMPQRVALQFFYSVLI